MKQIAPQSNVNDDLCYFFRQFEKDQLLRKVAMFSYIGEEDLDGFYYEKIKVNEYCIFGFSLSGIGFFNTVSILKTRFGSIIEMFTFNTSCFDDSGEYFDTYTNGRVNGYYQRLKEKHVIKCKRVKRLNLYGKRIDCGIHKCQLYGCKVMISIQ